MPRRLLTFACLFVSFNFALAAERPVASPPHDEAAARLSWERHQSLERESLFKGLPWRSVGPIVQGGRLVDIEVVPGEPYSFYVAYASGGLWKTTNNGMTFEPLFDRQATIIMGDVEIDPQNPQTIWVGTGENNSSRSSYGGAGVYRSDDGGKTWRHAGLWETDRIGRILVDPRDSDHVLVAALGRLYTDSGLRGLFRTRDGGDTWDTVLEGTGFTGFVDLVRHPDDPDVIYAASWERSRRPWDFVEGGEGSGVWKSTNNGETWTRLGGGLPRGAHVGRVGLAVTPASPDSLYVFIDNQEMLPEADWDLGGAAVSPKRLRGMTKAEFLRQDPDEVEAFLRAYDIDRTLDAKKLIKMIEDGTLTLEQLLKAIEDANRNLFETDIRGAQVWRSEDAGLTFRLTHDEPIRNMVHTYGYYFGQIRVAPDDPNRIYILGVPLLTSADGGRSWTNINGREQHVDHQALWIDPAFPRRLINGNDGGLYMSFDGGASWLQLNQISVGQFYTVAVDDAEPYNIYGGLQDNGTLMGSSRSRPGITPEWRRVGGGDGMYIAIDPRDSTRYIGFQFGNYFRSGPGGRDRVKPFHKLDDTPLRFNWQTPIQLSAHNADILYFGANKLFRSMDKGETLKPISPDLTRSQERGDVPFATITTLDESSLDFGLIWAGTDDGFVHVTGDGGVEWSNVSAGLPTDRWVSRVEASHHDADVAYVSLNGYRDDDIRAYVYRTADRGKSWTDISAGLPAEAVNVVREDPVNADVLYVGTDRGVYVSLDRGRSWQTLPAELPNVPVHDLVVHPRDRELVAGTHGRSVWVIDVLPVQELTQEVRAEPLTVFPLETVDYSRSWQSRRPDWWYRPEDDPTLNVPFWSDADGEVALVIEDEDGRPLRRLSMEALRGINVFEWDYLLDEDSALAAERARLQAARNEAEKERKKKRGKKKSAAGAGEDNLKDQPWAEAVRLERPLYVTPGTYTLRVVRGDASASTKLEVKPPSPREPRIKPEPKIRGRKKDD